MDNKKIDTGTDAIVRFIEGHESNMIGFGDNRAIDRLYRKTERVVIAAHILTSHIPVQEPLRREIRAVSSGFLSCLLSMRDDMRSVQSPHIQDFEASIRHVSSLVRLAAVSSYVSFQNADLLIESLDDVVYLLRASQKTSYADNVRLTKDFFSDVRMSTYKQESRGPQDAGESLKRTRPVRDEKEMNEKPVLPSLDPTRLSQRSDQVIAVLRTQDNQSIRDVVAQLPEYSEKMIQRELAELVHLGKVRKEGKKRWSTYSLLHN